MVTGSLAAQQTPNPRRRAAVLHATSHSTFVIVHGAWGGGWDWLTVDSMLTTRGHRVKRVTLTGLGERRHLSSPDIGLSTHIDDVVNAIVWDNLSDVVLVGHSYGGMVITGVADRIPERIKRLVYLDAFLPDSGESALGLADSAGVSFVRSSVRNGMIVPGWVTDTTAIPRDVPQSFRTFTDTLRLVNPAGRAVPAVYILTFEPNVTPDPFQRYADRAAARGWPVERLQADHIPERSARGELVAMLERLQTPPPELLIRIDDLGMNHSVNLALAQLGATGIPLSASVMFACPWYQEAVEILKRNPQISVGVHLVLNSEWKGYRWGPVLGKDAVPSLVDSLGYFLSSTDQFLARPYSLGEVERELSAQMERAVRSGLKIAYVDYHMGTAVGTPELRAIVERVAAKFGTGISRYFGERYHTMFDVPIAQKRTAFRAHLDSLAPGKVNLVVVHAAQGTPEMRVLVDMNNPTQNTATGQPLMALHRQAELEMLLDFARTRAAQRVTLVTYAALMERLGRSALRRP
jgi:predicted glycoside hydrolase/deacetylase ChbG (UPF0249 family)/pimeloyl-ACP methyl ester carboxylesterase